MFHNLKIGAKLYLLTGILSLIMILVGIMGLRSGRSANQGLKDVYEANTVALSQLSEMAQANLRIRMNVSTMIIKPTAEEIAKRGKNIDDDVALIAEQWKQYTAYPPSAEEKKIMDKTLQDRTRYREEALFPIMKMIKEGRHEEAKAFFLDKYHDLYVPVAEDWSALIKYQVAEAKATYEQELKDYEMARNISVAFILLGLALGGAVAWWIISGIAKPLSAGVEAMQQIAKGNLAVSIETKGRDEIGQVMSAMKEMAEELKEMVRTIKVSADSVASASEELSASSEQMSRGVTEQAGRASQIATASEEMSQTIIDVAKNASEIASSAKQTTSVAHDGEAIVGKSVAEVKEIADSVGQSAQLILSLGEKSKQIGEIISVINDIAEQTNLLALNAAIEAARAGEQGRGFAVVADEVRKLAERTAKATAEIRDMIGSIQSEVDGAVHSMNEASGKVQSGVEDVTKAGDALERIVQSVNSLNSMVEQIASATEEMSTTSESISSDVETIASVSKETSSGSEQIAQSASDLSRLSAELQKIVGKFRV